MWRIGNISFIIGFMKRKGKLASSAQAPAVKPRAAKPSAPGVLGPLAPVRRTKTTAIARRGQIVSTLMPGPPGPASATERIVADGFRMQTPVKDLPGVAIEDVRLQPERPFDIAFELRSGSSRVSVCAEIKQDYSPRRLAEIAPWVQRLRSLRQDVSVAVATPYLSQQSQAFCIQNGIDFFDLAGNVFVNVPGKFTLQRTGVRVRGKASAISTTPAMNVFSGRSSRVLRVLLERQQEWSVKGIADELARESDRLAAEVPQWQFDLRVSMGTVSKAITSLEEQLWIRRQGNRIVVPEPARLLQQWADKYKERYRWRLRGAVQTVNPFGANISAIAEGLQPSVSVPFAASGALAVQDVAPWVEADIVDLFIPTAIPDAKALAKRLNSFDGEGSGKGTGFGSGSGSGRGFGDGTGSDEDSGSRLRFIVPFDIGVFMYCRRRGAAIEVSLVQAYLDLYARGGRDLKQAEHLLAQAIEPQWSKA